MDEPDPVFLDRLVTARRHTLLPSELIRLRRIAGDHVREVLEWSTAFLTNRDKPGLRDPEAAFCFGAELAHILTSYDAMTVPVVCEALRARTVEISARMAEPGAFPYFLAGLEGTSFSDIERAERDLDAARSRVHATAG